MWEISWGLGEISVLKNHENLRNECENMKKVDFKKLLEERILVFDGAMGTMLQARGLKTDECPEIYNLFHKDIILDIHRHYVDTGCDIIQTNTFGANKIKLSQYGLANSAAEINQCAVEIGRKAGNGRCLLAGDIGPVGKLLYPFGELSFDETYEAFYEQAKVLIQEGVDLINIETMSDIHEAKIAVMAVKAAGDIPTICSITYNQNLRTLMGTDPESAVTILEALGVDVIGTNCGFGPDLMVEVLQRTYQLSNAYLIAQPNAGLPRLVGGQAVYDLSPDTMGDFVEPLIHAGANIIGGCCGTTPEHIKRIAAAVKGVKPLPREKKDFSKLASGAKTVIIGENLTTKVIGECINPTARKYLIQAVKEDNMNVIVDEAIKQVESGAHIIDVNMGMKLSEISEGERIEKAILAIQGTVRKPLSIDTIDLEAMEAGLKVYRGKPLLNSTNGEDGFLDAVIDLALKYGAAILGLTLDGKGIPEKAEERYKIAEKIVNRALEKGMKKQDIFIDGLTLTAGAQQKWVLETLKTIRHVKEKLGVRTILGVSNVSHGLPNREKLNSSFLAMALEAGLDIPIMNPYHENMWTVIQSADVLTGKDPQAANYIKIAQNSMEEDKKNLVLSESMEESPEQKLAEAIKTGDKGQITGLIEKLKTSGTAAMDIINKCVIPALEVVGELYEKHIFFLPQLLLAAEAAQKTFDELKEDLQKSGQETIGTIVLSTVKGDIHDIGKNIVSIMLQNHGFQVIDLGKDVHSELIIRTAVEKKADIIGLSALMTTTMQEMKKIKDYLKQMNIPIPVLIGGAVVTQDYADEIGAYYAEDAVDAVKQAKKIILERE